MNYWNRVDGCLQAMGGFLLGAQCVLCGASGAHGLDLCAPCALALPRNLTCCPRCALPLTAPAPLCGRCLQRAPPYVRAVVPLRYELSVALLMPRYKFRGDLAVGRVLTQSLLDALIGHPRPDLVVPVPLHRQRLRQRGFDQSWEIARMLARSLELPARCDVLRRVRATLAQTGLDAAARRKNMRGAFSARVALDGLSIALVDDVVTTGTTVAAAAAALRAAGAARVFLWAVARAPLSGQRKA